MKQLVIGDLLLVVEANRIGYLNCFKVLLEYIF